MNCNTTDSHRTHNFTVSYIVEFTVVIFLDLFYDSKSILKYITCFDMWDKHESRNPVMCVWCQHDLRPDFIIKNLFTVNTVTVQLPLECSINTINETRHVALKFNSRTHQTWENIREEAIRTPWHMWPESHEFDPDPCAFISDSDRQTHNMSHSETGNVQTGGSVSVPAYR